MQVIYCEKCHNRKKNKSIESVTDDLKEVTGCDNVIKACMSYCGPGSKNHIVMIDDDVYEDPTYNGLISKLKETL